MTYSWDVMHTNVVFLLLASWQGAISVEERLQRAREALRLEKEAHRRTRQELDELKGVLAGMCGGTPTVGCAADRKLPSMPSMGTVLVHTSESDRCDASAEVEQGTSATQQPLQVDSDAYIAWRIRNVPRTRQPSQLQTSPYVNPVRHVYKARKRRRSPTHEAVVDPQPMNAEEDRGRQPGAEGSDPQPEAGLSVGDCCFPGSEVCTAVHICHVAWYGVLRTADHHFLQYADA